MMFWKKRKADEIVNPSDLPRKYRKLSEALRWAAEGALKETHPVKDDKTVCLDSMFLCLPHYRYELVKVAAHMAGLKVYCDLVDIVNERYVFYFSCNNLRSDRTRWAEYMCRKMREFGYRAGVRYER